jgi:hypothetical protein
MRAAQRIQSTTLRHRRGVAAPTGGWSTPTARRSWVQAQFVETVDIYRFTLVCAAHGQNYNTTRLHDAGLRYSDDGVIWYERTCLVHACASSALSVSAGGYCNVVISTSERWRSHAARAFGTSSSKSQTFFGSSSGTLPKLTTSGQQYSEGVLELTLPAGFGRIKRSCRKCDSTLRNRSGNKLGAIIGTLERFITALSLPALHVVSDGYVAGTLVRSALPALSAPRYPVRLVATVRRKCVTAA